MTRQKMFFRMITASLIRRRSRMIVALLAIAVGATILSGLVTIYYDVPRQMGAEFRNYGANMIILPSEGGATFTKEEAEDALSVIPDDALVGYAPYRYEAVSINEQPIVAAATDMEGAKKASPYWYIEGEWPDAPGELLIGKEIKTLLSTDLGKTLTVTYTHMDEEYIGELAAPKTRLNMTIVGILETGGSEEEYVYMATEDIETLSETSDSLDLVEVSVSAANDELSRYAEEITETKDHVQARLVKRVTQSESTVLTKLQALVLLVTVIVLALTMICVATTMMAVVTERRKEIGLRKALGASNGSIIGEFMGEGLLLGLIGGLLGAGAGFAFAQAVSINVFSSSIVFRPLLLPVTVLVSILVTGLACMIPVRSATDIDPALVLKGE